MASLVTNTDVNHALEREYCIAVAHKSIDQVDVSSETNDQKKYHEMNRRLSLPEGEYFDFYQFVTNTTTMRYKLISADYCRTEGKIDEVQAHKRCVFLCLAAPERFVSHAINEISEDREKAIKWCEQCLTYLMVKVAQTKGITHGHSPSKKVTSLAHMGKALTECKCEHDFEALWDSVYGLFDIIPTWKDRLEEACLAQFGWKIDDTDIVCTSLFTVNCIHKLASLALNNLRRVVNGFAKRKKTPTISIKRPNSAITAENRWKKQVKKEFNPFFVVRDNAVSIYILMYISNINI